MKKILLTLCSLLAGAVFVHAQATFKIFGNLMGGGVMTNTSNFYAQNVGIYTVGLMAPSTSGQVYDFAMLVATTTNAADETPWGADWSVADLYGTSTPVMATNFFLAAGQMAGPGGSSGFEQANLVPGNSEYVMLVGWSANLGSMNQVLGDVQNNTPDGVGFFGYSTAVYIEGGGAGTATSPPTSVNGQIPQFDLYAVVPEPTTLALVGLGSLSMLILRRRKS